MGKLFSSLSRCRLLIVIMRAASITAFHPCRNNILPTYHCKHDTLSPPPRAFYTHSPPPTSFFRQRRNVAAAPRRVRPERGLQCRQSPGSRARLLQDLIDYPPRRCRSCCFVVLFIYELMFASSCRSLCAPLLPPSSRSTCATNPSLHPRRTHRWLGHPCHRRQHGPAARVYKLVSVGYAATMWYGATARVQL